MIIQNLVNNNSVKKNDTSKVQLQSSKTFWL